MVIKIQGFCNRDQNPCYYFGVVYFGGKFMQDAEGYKSPCFFPSVWIAFHNKKKLW